MAESVFKPPASLDLNSVNELKLKENQQSVMISLI